MVVTSSADWFRAVDIVLRSVDSKDFNLNVFTPLQESCVRLLVGKRGRFVSVSVVREELESMNSRY